MASDTFWSTSGMTPAQEVIRLDQPGDLQPGAAPMGQIPGTTAGAIPPAYTTSARAVYPWDFDYTKKNLLTGLTRQQEYDALNVADFPGWHSLYQAKYLSTNGYWSSPAVNRTTPSARPDAFYILQSDGRTVLNLMTLTVTDYQRLPKADRDALNGEPVFNLYVAPSLGLVFKGSATAAITTAIADARSVLSQSKLSSADRDVFEQQIKLFESRINGQTRIVVQTAIKEIGAIAERLQRVVAFADKTPQTNNLRVIFDGVDDRKTGNYYASFTTEVKGYVISSDDGKTVDSGLAKLMQSEREILTAQLRRDAMSRVTAVVDPKNDVAQLIYKLQLMYQAESQAISDGGTEEMSQLHRLLSDYAIMQRLVNETLKAYNPKDTEQRRRFLNIGGKTDGGIETAQTLGERPDSGQDTRVIYQWTPFDAVAFGDRSTGGYDTAPRFSWYLLGGTIANPLIDPTTFTREVDDGNGGVRSDAWDQITARYSDTRSEIAVQAGGLTAAEMRIVAMFSKDEWGSGRKFAKHPLEAYYKADRPMQDLTDDSKDGVGSLRLEWRDYWDKWGTQLSDTVTILNQKNQLKQNEIENATKEANRHFDLGNNALKKMNEMLMSIGRA